MECELHGTAWHWGRVFLLLFAPTRLTCVKGKAKKTLLFTVRNISVFCLREQLPRQWFIHWSHSPLIHLLSKPQAQKKLLVITEQGCPWVANTGFLSSKHWCPLSLFLSSVIISGEIFTSPEYIPTVLPPRRLIHGCLQHAFHERNAVLGLSKCEAEFRGYWKLHRASGLWTQERL